MTLITQQASRSEDFVQSIGINTHIGNLTSTYGDLQAIYNQLNYLGIDKVREVIPGADIFSYQTLAAEGIRFDLVYPYPPSLALTTAGLEAQVGVLDMLGVGAYEVEGPNEPNIIGVNFNGVTGPAGAVALQKALYSAIHNDPILNNATRTTNVLAFSLSPGAIFSAYGNLDAYSDYTNAHAYARYGVPPYWALGNEINAITNTPGKPLQITESGVYTALDHNSGVSEAVQAKWDVDILLQGLQLGSVGTFLYQLQDAFNDPSGTNFELHYGLFHVDGTPKLAATAIHDLTTILSDSDPRAGTFTPGSLTYGLTGMPYYGFQTLMAKANGSFDLALWSEPKIWDATSDTDVVVAPSSVTLTLAQSFATINVYDVLVGTAPIATYHNVSSIPISLGTDPLIIEIVPNDPAAPASVTLAEGASTVSGNVVAQAGSGTYTVTVNDAETIIGGSGSLTVSLGGAGASVMGGSGKLTVVDTKGGNTITGGSFALDMTASAGDDVISTGTSAGNVVRLGSGKNAVTTLGATTVMSGRGIANLTLDSAGSVVHGDAGVLMVSDLVGGNTVIGGVGALAITAKVGNDVIVTGTSYVNSVMLGAGNDTVTANGQATVIGGTGTATVTLNKTASFVIGGTGTMNVTDNAGGNIFIGSTGVFNITDRVGGDTITVGAGGKGRVTLGAGNDTVTASGMTTIYGGSGNAVITLSGAGNLVGGGAGSLTISDAIGGNTIISGPGALSVTALVGVDRITTRNTSGVSNVQLGSGTDVVTVAGATNINANTSTLTVLASANVSVNGGMGSINFTGTTGSEYIFTQAGTKNRLVFGNGKNSALSHGSDVIYAGAGTTNIIGSGASLVVYGGSGALSLMSQATTTTLVGGSGAMSVNSKSGKLSVTGGAGAMTVSGGTGSDYVFTQTGIKNVINLGSGADTVLSHGADTINASAATGAGLETIYAGGAASITGGAGLLMINGQAAGLTVKGGTGMVNTFAAGSNSYVKGGSGGGNVLTAAGGNTTLVGGGAGDRLSDTGSAGGNLLTAGPGAATLMAGIGNDTLAGGSGTDLFVLAAAAAAHSTVIQGYVSGSDRLGFTGFGSATPIASQQVVGGNLQLTLADNAAVTLVGVTHL